MPSLGGTCYSNTTTLTTGNWGEWKTEQNGVGVSCNSLSQSYFLNININGADQTPRRRLDLTLLRDSRLINTITSNNLQISSPTVTIIMNQSGFVRNIIKNLDGGSSTTIINTLENDVGRQFSLVLASSTYNFTGPNRSNIGTISLNSPAPMWFSIRYYQPFIWKNNPADDGSLVSNQTDVMRLEPEGNLILPLGGINASGNVTANYFIGNGSLLTGINSGSMNLTNYALKNQSETFAGNITTAQTGFFGWLGSLTSRITKLFVQDININGTLNISGDITGVTNEVFYDVETSGNLGNFRVRGVGATGNQNFDIVIPEDFVSLVSVEAVGIVSAAGTAGANKDIDINSDCGSDGESYNVHTGSDTTSTYTIPALSTIWEINISGVFNSISAGDYCGVNIDHNSIGGSIDYLGIKLKYKN